MTPYFSAARRPTLSVQMGEPGNFTTGFDYLRIVLAVAVLVAHSVALSAGSDTVIWTGPWRFIAAALLPMFFALSGFLVTGSLLRVRLHQFFALRLARLIPALAVEITLCALIIGPLVTILPIGAYFAAEGFTSYFLNIVGLIQYDLPGVFVANPFGDFVNGQLWTIPFEFECYAVLALLAVLKIVNRRAVFAAAVVAICLGMTVRVVAAGTIDQAGHVPGRMLVVAFLAGVVVYLYRDRLPFSHALGAAAAVASALLLQVPELCYLTPFPIAYATAWLGLMRPPPIPFGDLSYGVYLFHWPVEQSIAHVFAAGISWWAMTVLALPLTAVCAWLSWMLIEQPVLKRKRAILRVADRVVDAIGELVGQHKAAA